MKNKKVALLGIAVLIIALGVGGFALTRKSDSQSPEPTVKTLPKAEVNLIPVSERPYVTLQPLAGRNQLEITIHELKKPAESVEVAVEYDRNKGTQDAVLYTYDLTKVPYTDTVFLGSKSAGGHTTFHDDVIGGQIRFDFKDEDYSLLVPWRYDDTQESYNQLSTADAKFQLQLKNPIKQKKVVVMTSPGLPAAVEGELLAGPYYIGTVGKLPTTTAEVTIRLTEEAADAVIMGWNGEEWTEFETTVDGKTATATVDLMQTYVVVGK